MMLWPLRWRLSLFVFAVFIVSGTYPQSFGHEQLCPCMDEADLKKFPIETTPEVLALLDGVNTTRYGLGCLPHDTNTPRCRCNESDGGICKIPESCSRSWCYVKIGCQLQQHPSNAIRVEALYSYATCGELDLFTKDKQVDNLEGKTLKVGFNRNSGGWLGAYSDGGHFEGPLERWSGPVVDFIKAAAKEENLTIEVTVPPAGLRNRSNEFYGSDSSFDFCVYAASLGYLDFCVAQYTVTDLRATSTHFLLLDSFGMFLILRTDTTGDNTGWDAFVKSINVVFQPLTRQTWTFIALFVIPVFSILMVYHEYGKSGSSFPSEEKVIETKYDGTMDLKFRRVTRFDSIFKSVYTVALSVMQQAYEQPVTTLGAKLNLLGVSVFILTICAAYTANLAALLTQQAQETGVENLDDAIREGYRFCAERKNMESLVAIHDNLQASMFVVDPISLGGDGKPGFNCGKCSSRIRVFDYLDPEKATKGDELYCHAAIAPLEDLNSLHADGTHCNISQIGRPVHYSQTGFPIYETVAGPLTSLFLRLKNEGVMDKAILDKDRIPRSQCDTQPLVSGEEENIALSLYQLSGIWIVSFGFALVGLVATLSVPLWKLVDDFRGIQVHKRDQIGTIIETFDLDDNEELLKSSMEKRVRNWRNRDSKGNPISESLIVSSTAFEKPTGDFEQPSGPVSTGERNGTHANGATKPLSVVK